MIAKKRFGLAVFMGKYLTVVTTSFQASQVWRLRILIWVIIDMYPFILPFVWLAVFGDRGEINGLTRQGLVLYFINIAIFGGLAISHIDDEIDEDINGGRFSQYLVLPMSYFWYRMAKEIGYKINRLMLMPIPYFLVILAYSKFSSISFSVSFEVIIKAIIILPFAYLLFAVMLYGVALTAFWFEDAWGILAAFWMVFSLFSGLVAPLELMPSWLEQIAQFLPFKYVLAFPAGTLAGNWPEPFILSLVKLTIWLAAFYLINIFVERMGIKKYSAVGN